MTADPQPCAAAAGSGRVSRWALRLAVVAAVAYALSGVRAVGPAERGVVQRCGRVVDDHVVSGVHFGLPLGIERLTRLEMRKSRRLGVGFEVADRVFGGLPDPAQSQFLTGDRNIIDLQMSVQYVVADSRAFLFATADPAGLVRRVCEDTLCAIVGSLPVDDVLTQRRAEVNLRVREAAQATLNRLGVGVQVLSTTLERAAPPEVVADAFRDVTSARADRGRKIAEAEGYRDDLLPRARGEASRVAAEAGAVAYATLELARGRAARFEKRLAEAEHAPDVTRQRLHAEAMEEVLGRTRKVVVGADGAGVRLIEEAP